MTPELPGALLSPGRSPEIPEVEFVATRVG
jgi:hypothetical protein